MATDRLRVVPRYEPKGMLATAVLLGSLSGAAPLAIVSGLGTGLSRFDQTASVATPMFLLGVVLAVALVFTPAILFGIAVSLVCQRRMPVFGAGAVFWGAMFIAYVFTVGFVTGDGYAWLLSQKLVWMLVVAAAVGVVGGVFHLGLRMLSRMLLFVIVEQDGQRCWRCGYPAGSDRIQRCPECGTPMDPNRYRAQWLHRVVRVLRSYSHVALIIMFAAGLALVAPRFVREGVPDARFLRRFAGGGAGVGMVIPHTSGAPLSGHGAVGVMLPLNGNPGGYVNIAYMPLDVPGAPAMQLQVHGVAYNSAGVEAFELGSPRVLCDLNRAQAEYVVRNGAPPALLEAISQAMATSGWTTWGVLVWPQRPDVWVDAAPFFPAP